MSVIEGRRRREIDRREIEGGIHVRKVENNEKEGAIEKGEKRLGE